MAALADAFDGFILDQWGVLHDGTRPYPGAVECLQRLHEAGKRIVVLSNSGKRDAENLRLMAKMGFAAGLLDRFVSAGEDARIALQSRTEPFHGALGPRCYAFTRGGDRSLLEGIGLEFVERVGLHPLVFVAATARQPQILLLRLAAFALGAEVFEGHALSSQFFGAKAIAATVLRLCADAAAQIGRNALFLHLL